MFLWYNKHLINKSTQILNKSCKPSPCAIAKQVLSIVSGNQYDLIFLQETHLLSTEKFQIPGYYTLRTDRTFGRQGPVSSGTHNTGGSVLTLIHSDLAFSPIFL